VAAFGLDEHVGGGEVRVRSEEGEGVAKPDDVEVALQHRVASREEVSHPHRPLHHHPVELDRAVARHALRRERSVRIREDTRGRSVRQAEPAAYGRAGGVVEGDHHLQNS